jgi:hypothetical protein
MNVLVTATNENGILTITSPQAESAIGTIGDNNIQTIEFELPPEYADHKLTAVLDSGGRITDYAVLGNSFVLNMDDQLKSSPHLWEIGKEYAFSDGSFGQAFGKDGITGSGGQENFLTLISNVTGFKRIEQGGEMDLGNGAVMGFPFGYGSQYAMTNCY